MTSQSTDLTWSKTNLTVRAGSPPSLQPRPCLRSDGISSVVSYSIAPPHVDNRIYEITLSAITPSGEEDWDHADLDDHALEGPVEGHTPSTYVRSDGITAVVYLSKAGENTMHVHEVALTAEGWRHGNLSALTGAPVSVGGTLQGYVRGDGTTAVVYVGEENRIHEIALVGGTTWVHADLTKETGAPIGNERGPHGSLQAFARSDGATSIVYTCGDGEVRQLRLDRSGDWKFQTLTADGGEPKAAGYGLTAYVRTDGMNAIVYRGVDQHLYELTLVNGQWDELNDLTALTGAAPATGHVYGYNRGDGTSTVIYEGPGYHIHELALVGGRTWSHADLTEHTHSKPGFQPVGYVRGDGTTAIVYYDTDEQVRQLKLS